MTTRPPNDRDPHAPPDPGVTDTTADPGHSAPHPLTRRELDHLADRFGLGTLRSVRPIGRGTARGGAVRAETDWGVVAIKRRDHTDPARAAFTHRARLFLSARGVPFPPLLGTHDENNSLVVFEGVVYEAAAWIDRRECRPTADDARASGTALAQLHLASADAPDALTTDPKATIPGPFDADPDALRDAVARWNQPEATLLLDLLNETDRDEETTPTLIHGDWHPGNLLLDDGPSPARVRAVLDPDQIRLGATSTDLGAALLHHSFVREDTSCDQWPAPPAIDRLHAVWSGYTLGLRATPGPCPLPDPDATARAMVRTLASEALTRVLSGADLGRHDPAAFVVMAAQKATWLASHAAQSLGTAPV